MRPRDAGTFSRPVAVFLSFVPRVVAPSVALAASQSRTGGTKASRSPAEFASRSATRRNVRARCSLEIAKVLTASALYQLPSRVAPHPTQGAGRRTRSTGLARRRGHKRDRHDLLGLPPRRELRASPRPPLTRAFPAIRAGASRRCRWPGREKRSATSAGSSKTSTATAGATWRCCRSISPRMIWWLGAGILVRAASRRQAVRRPPENWSRPGSIPEPSAPKDRAAIKPQ